MYLEDCSDLTRRFGALPVMEWINKVYTCFDESAPIQPRAALRVLTFVARASVPST